MATVLTKRVVREVPRAKAQRPFIVTLKPGGYLGIREKGLRTEYEVSMEAVYWLAAKKAAEELREERHVRRKVKRGLLGGKGRKKKGRK